MFGNRESNGFSWSFSSKKDPRFKGAGQSYGMFGSTKAIEEAIQTIAKHFDIELPDDIEYSACKN